MYVHDTKQLKACQTRPSPTHHTHWHGFLPILTWLLLVAAVQVGGQLPGGLWLRGLSGGERKRLSLAAGLLGSPGMLFLDEPTSGLDSSAALSVVSHLQQLAARQQKLVLVCVHQPRAAIWSLFDKVSWEPGHEGLSLRPCRP
jgi:ABC-type uncharacterized transport system fused permease/ATPase subunit